MSEAVIKTNLVCCFIDLMFSWITLAWMDGVECVTMALDASIAGRPSLDKYIVKITRKIGLEEWG